MEGLVIKNLVLRNIEPINLSVEKGIIAGIAGESGIGKSLLLRALADIDPHEGEVFFDGKSVESFPAHEWRRLVGLLPAESPWWFDVLGEHFSDPDQSLFNALGFDMDVLLWSITRLSSGEKQRLAVARLLNGNSPGALLLDEPTANLDSGNTQRVEDLITDYAKKQSTAVIVVSHDTEQLDRLSDQKYFLDRTGLKRF